jgi:1,2-diacylglycerol 3-beta-glucosyltransferase
MTVGAAASGVQRQRWEGGRFAIARRHAIDLIRQGIWRRNRVLLDLGMDLATPPLAYLAGAAAIGSCLSGLSVWLLEGSVVALGLWLWSLAAILAYVVRGWWLSGTGVHGLRALLHAPAYLAWKVGMLLRGSQRPGEKWIRTPRERGP